MDIDGAPDQRASGPPARTNFLAALAVNHECDWRCRVENVAGNLWSCVSSGQLHVCDAHCDKKVFLDKHSAVCAISRRRFEGEAAPDPNRCDDRNSGSGRSCSHALALLSHCFCCCPCGALPQEAWWLCQPRCCGRNKEIVLWHTAKWHLDAGLRPAQPHCTALTTAPFCCLSRHGACAACWFTAPAGFGAPPLPCGSCACFDPLPAVQAKT
jgi:hypothetical protein